MIRLFLIIIYLILFFTIGQVFLLIGLVVELFNKDVAYNYYKSIINSVFWTIMFLADTKVDIKGLEYIKDDTYLIVANHRSIFDIITLFPYINIKFGFIAKKELNIPIFNIWMKKINCIFIDRDNLRQGLEVINKSVDNIKNNISMMIFPEGTRNRSSNFYEMLDFKEGSFKIAKISKCKILPIAIKNADECFEKNNNRIKSAIVSIVVGEPVDIDNISSEYQDQLGKYIKNIILKL